MKKKYKHIIWDWNGTFLNDVDYCRRIINRILVENELPKLSLEKYREIFTFPVQDYYKEAGLDFSKTSFEILGKEFIDEYESKKLTCSLYDNAPMFYYRYINGDWPVCSFCLLARKFS